MQVQRRLRQPLNVHLSTRTIKLGLLFFATVLPALQAEVVHLRPGQSLLFFARARSGGEGLDNGLRTSQQISKTLARAEAGSAHDQFLIGYAYAKGLGQPQDYSQALVWY